MAWAAGAADAAASVAVANGAAAAGNGEGGAGRWPSASFHLAQKINGALYHTKAAYSC